MPDSVLEDYADITVKRERMKKMKADPYYNALQVNCATVPLIVTRPMMGTIPSFSLLPFT